ncbi:MAG TPA: undecaprenyl-diphosphate phosphatase [Acidimicrobiales bacterium]
MSTLHAIVLGIVQGLSEFLPISSSGHLEIVPWLFGWDDLADRPDVDLTFDVALHLGTFVGALVYFRRDIVVLAAAAFRVLRTRRVDTDDERMAMLLVVASLPAATIGAVLDAVLDGAYGPIWVIGVMLIVFGLVLGWADRLPERREITAFRPRDAVLMGFAQALALQPGVSRSGATISMGRWLGFTRDAATRISFLMSLPIIGGAAAYKGLDVFVVGDGLPAGFAAPFAWGMASAAVTGFVAVWGLLRVLRTWSFAPFVWYRIVLGANVIVLAAVR